MKKILLLLALVVFLVFILPLTIELAVRYQPVQAATQQVDDLPTNVEWVRVRLDERMFTLFAALNAAGYDDENFGEPFHPVRQLVRERLEGKSFSGLWRLRAELTHIDGYKGAIWMLHYGNPPEFKRQEKSWFGDGIQAFYFFGLDKVLADFYQEMDIASLWQEVLPQYELEAARYQEASGLAIQSALDYTRLKEVSLQQVVVIPNLLDAHWRGYGPHIGDTAYVINGPTGDKVDTGLIQHEALHSIAGPIIDANLESIDPQHAKELYDILRDRVPDDYGSWDGIVEESVIRALGARLAGPDWEEQVLRNEEQAGFLLVRVLAGKLKEFEAGSATLEEYMPELLSVLCEVDPKSFE